MPVRKDIESNKKADARLKKERQSHSPDLYYEKKGSLQNIYPNLQKTKHMINLDLTENAMYRFCQMEGKTTHSMQLQGTSYIEAGMQRRTVS